MYRKHSSSARFAERPAAAALAAAAYEQTQPRVMVTSVGGQSVFTAWVTELRGTRRLRRPFVLRKQKAPAMLKEAPRKARERQTETATSQCGPAHLRRRQLRQ